MSIATRVSIPALLIGVIVLCLPLFAHAVGTVADTQCAVWIPTHCGCKQQDGPNGSCTPNPANTYKCPVGICKDSTNGFPTDGICVAAGKCQGVTTNGSGVDSGLSQLGGILGQLLGKLMQGQSSGSGSGSGSTPSISSVSSCSLYYSVVSSDASGTTATLSWNTTNASGATLTPPGTSVALNGSQQVLVTTPTTYTLSVTGSGGSGSCQQTIIPGGGMGSAGLNLQPSTNGCDSLSQLLGTCSGSSDGSGVTVTNNNTNTNTNTTQTQPTTQTTVIAASSTVNLPSIGMPSVLGPGGAFGDITLSGTGATIFGSAQNLPNNTTVAGFFGGDTLGGQSQGLAAQLCQSRPWANSFVSSIIPATFFDGLCSWRGYQVGTPPAPAAPVVQLQQSVPAPQTTTTAPAAPTSTAPVVPPSVKIWAVPASVPLDTRTSIFWSTQGVTQCTVTSPDGNFSQNTLSGGAATVPLVAATTFTISCLDPQGNPVTAYTTVNISI